MPAISSLLIIAGGITMSALAANKQRRKRFELLETVARRRGGHLDSGGWFGVPRVELTSADGIQIDITQWSTRHDQYTEYRAFIPSPGLPRCKVAPGSFTGWLGVALGAQDIAVGEPAFDDEFVVKGEDPVLVKRMWTRSCAQAMAGLGGGTGRLECAGTDLKLRLPVATLPEQIEVAIDFILELARTDPYGLDALEGLPERRRRSTTSLPHVELPGPSTIRVGPREQGGRVRTCVWTVAVGAPDTVLPDDVATNVTALGGSLDRTAAELRLWWEGIETDPRRLLAAVELVRRLAGGPSLGVFR